MIVDDVKALSVSKLDAAGRIAVPLIEDSTAAIISTLHGHLSRQSLRSANASVP